MYKVLDSAILADEGKMQILKAAGGLNVSHNAFLHNEYLI